MDIIEELLGEQPDSKCKSCLGLDAVSLTRTPGCMDSLVYYNRLMLKNYCPNSEDIRQKCLGFLQQLEQIDSPRKSSAWSDPPTSTELRETGQGASVSVNVQQHLSHLLARSAPATNFYSASAEGCEEQLLRGVAGVSTSALVDEDSGAQRRRKKVGKSKRGGVEVWGTIA
ncbi:hypothetical protein J3R82DRAFT_5407 [Butyriboletus roseoflavus]|nr:hypothetical protein J3R82DRAFT_5407 [Butyriboletus roseoflavus]